MSRDLFFGNKAMCRAIPSAFDDDVWPIMGLVTGQLVKVQCVGRWLKRQGCYEEAVMLSPFAPACRGRTPSYRSLVHAARVLRRIAFQCTHIAKTWARLYDLEEEVGTQMTKAAKTIHDVAERLTKKATLTKRLTKKATLTRD